MKLFFFVLLLSLGSCSSVKNVTDTLSLDKPDRKINEFFPLWFKNNDPSHDTGNLPIATNWPVVYKGILYVGDNRGAMVAYELENGREVWREFDGGTYSSAPVIYKDQVIYGTTEGRLFSRNRLNGKLKYKVDLGSSVETQGRIYKGMGFFHLRDHKLVSLDIETGKILWAYRRSVPYLTTVQRASRPLILNGKLYIGFADGHLCSFRIEDGILLWEQKISEGTKFVDVDLSPIKHGNNILVGSLAGNLLEVSPNSGTVIRKFTFQASRSPVHYNGNLLVGTTTGELIYLSTAGKLISQVKLTGLPISSIKVWKDYFAVSTVSRRVFLIHKETFKVVQSFDLGHSTSAVFGEMQVSKDILSFLSSRNRLYVFK